MIYLDIRVGWVAEFIWLTKDKRQADDSVVSELRPSCNTENSLTDGGYAECQENLPPPCSSLISYAGNLFLVEVLSAAFAKLREATISFVMSACPSVLPSVSPCGTPWPPTGQIFMKCDI